MNIVQIQQINVSDFQSIISETIRNEVQKLIPKEPTNKKDSIYGTHKEVVKELKISLPILNKHTKNGTVHAYRIGDRVLYKRNKAFESVKLIWSLKY